jgi:hypothetical protein
MALSELAAIEAAYHALLSLDEAGRGRALRWLSDALDAPMPLAEGALAAASAAELSDPEPAAAPAVTRATRRRATAGAAARKAGKNGGASSTSARRRRRTANTSGGERAYRRMPDADEVMAAYRRVGSVSGLSDFFGVPTHTVQGWARRLREKGHQIGRQA